MRAISSHVAAGMGCGWLSIRTHRTATAETRQRFRPARSVDIEIAESSFVRVIARHHAAPRPHEKRSPLSHETTAPPSIAEWGLIGSSEPMKRLRRSIRRVAPLPAPVLIQGESGSGKELVARALHDASPRARRPFVAVNAAAIPSTLVASELFGHERGAFTGARSKRAGLFAQASGGTLFLDEIAELPFDLQAWLLRVLESGEVRPLGSDTATMVDVRVLAATHVDLGHLVRERRFRADLHFRLSVLTVRAPALRDHPEDVRAIAEHLLDGLGLPDRYELSPEALQALALHDWPGNVRELRAVLLRAAAFASRTVLEAHDVVRAIGNAFQQRARRLELDARSAALAVAEAGGNVAEAARRLGMPRTTLRDLLRAGAEPERIVH
ncbi:MAG: sigma-54-dependent Fis family transcriptional regulator [Sandaracinus sp.]|nr:sigma-54-dependent Fis family transcriptional regulator [Sandaracinus sp.]